MRVLRKSKRRSPKSESKGESEMRKMKRSDVREWIPGEPLERVDFGNGCTGMDKSIPKEPGNAGDFKRLIWKCRTIEADGGPCLDVLPSEYWIDDVKQAGYFDVVTDESSYGPCSFGDAWFYLAGVDAGWHLARRKRHSGLCATLRGIFDSLTHRHENATDAEPLVTASKPSRESAEIFCQRDWSLVCDSAMYKAPSRRCMASLSSNEPQLSQSLTHRRTSVVRLSTYDFNAAGMLTSSFRHCSISERKPEMFSLSLSSIRTSSSTPPVGDGLQSQNRRGIQPIGRTGQRAEVHTISVRVLRE